MREELPPFEMTETTRMFQTRCFSLLLALMSACFVLPASADETRADPRNRPGYAMLFDLVARGDSDFVDGYGAYLQWYDENPARPHFRYCDNFEGKGTSGRPNLNRSRMRFLPFGVVDEKAYRCHDYTPEEVARGRRVVYTGEKEFFALKTTKWNGEEGGEILFQIAKRLPLVGAPTHRILRIRAARAPGEWTVETVVPRAGVYPTEWFHFAVTTSGLGLPNGISNLVLNRNLGGERPIDLDTLESP
jgi:hypothetical protein